jgi:hypothetical protein
MIKSITSRLQICNKITWIQYNIVCCSKLLLNACLDIPLKEIGKYKTYNSCTWYKFQNVWNLLFIHIQLNTPVRQYIPVILCYIVSNKFRFRSRRHQGHKTQGNIRTYNCTITPDRVACESVCTQDTAVSKITFVQHWYISILRSINV